MKMLMVLLIYLNLLEVLEVSSQSVTIDPVGDVRVPQYSTVALTASYSGPGSVGVVTWVRNGVVIGALQQQADGTCTIFAGSVDPSIYEFSCGSGMYNWKILNVTVSEDEDVWICSANTGSVTPSSEDVILSVQVCTEISDGITVNTTDLSPNTAVLASCPNGGDSMTTICQAAGNWNPDPILDCEPECCCCCICCFIVLIVSVAIGILFTGGHIGFTWADHEYSVKKICSENNDTEAVCLKDYGIKVVLPKCCICLAVIFIQIAVYFAALKKDCNEHCDDCCGVVICLVVTIIVSIVKDAIESGIIYLVVHVKGRNYIDQGQPVSPKNGKVMIQTSANL